MTSEMGSNVTLVPVSTIREQPFTFYRGGDVFVTKTNKVLEKNIQDLVNAIVCFVL